MENFLGIDWYHIRITTLDTLDNMETFVKTLSSVYLISNETIPRNHYHICIKTQRSLETLRKLVKSSIYSGRNNYYLKPSTNSKQMLKYTLKDGNYVFKNIDEKWLETLRKCSNKKGLDKFGIELQTLEENFLGNSITFTQFGRSFIKLKIDYGQNLYGNHIKAYLTKMKCKKDPTYINEYFAELMR